MAQTVYDEVSDGNGNVLSRSERIVDDPEPTPGERIAQLEAQVAQLAGTMDAVARAPSFDEARAEIAIRIDGSVLELAIAEPVKGASRT